MQADRFNKGKTRFDLLEPAAIEMLARVFTVGADKYAPDNWLKGMNWTKMDASLQRHLSEWRQRRDVDPETGLSHMAHVAWNAMALLSYELHGLGVDDRRKMPLPEVVEQDRGVGMEVFTFTKETPLDGSNVGKETHL